MGNIVRYRPSVNLTTLGLLYVAAAVVQVWYWVEHLFLRHWDQVVGTFAMITGGPTLLSKALSLIAVAYHVMFAGIIFQLFYAGCKMVRLSWQPGVRIMQTGEHRLEMLKAIGFLLVVFIICFVFVPSMRPEGIILEMFAIELMGVMMASYSLMAVATYYGNR